MTGLYRLRQLSITLIAVTLIKGIKYCIFNTALEIGEQRMRCLRYGDAEVAQI